MKTILQLLDALPGSFSARPDFRGVREKWDGEAIIYDTFVSGEYDWDGTRYIYDFTRCKSSDGWHQYDTSQDASYFGVWYHSERMVVCTYAEGDETVVVCSTKEAWAKEVAQMGEFYGAPPPMAVGLALDGTVTEYYDEAARPSVEAK